MRNGVYRIRNLHNNKCYIGSTACLRGFTRRFSDHKRELKHKTHTNAILQAAWNKYGIEAFVFEILLFCSPEDCLLFEQIALDYYQPEYNICSKAGSHLGVKRSRATKAKISESKRGPKNPNYGRSFSQETRRLMSQNGLGDNNNNHKLSEEQVFEVFRLLDSGVKQAHIAKKFGCGKTTIYDIKTGRTWSYLRKAGRFQLATT